MSNYEQQIRNEQFKQVTGSAPNFRAIDGVGDKTAKKVRGVIGIDSPSDAADKTADELANEAGISESRAAKVIRGGGGDPNRSPRSRTGSVSAAGIKVPTGDFKTEIGDKDRADARFSSSLNRGIGRSPEAARADKAKRAPVTTDFDRWKNNKSGLDYPGIDTPSSEPKVLPKDLKQEQRPNTTDPENSLVQPRRDEQPFTTETRQAVTETVAPGFGFDPETVDGLKPVETSGVTDSTFERDMMADDGQRPAGGAKRGGVSQGFVDDLATGRDADIAFTAAEDKRGGDPFELGSGGFGESVDLFGGGRR